MTPVHRSSTQCPRSLASAASVCVFPSKDGPESAKQLSLPRRDACLRSPGHIPVGPDHDRAIGSDSIQLCLGAVHITQVTVTLPWPLVWLGFVMGGYHLVETPIQLAINGSAGGVTGPIDVCSFPWSGSGRSVWSCSSSRPDPGVGACCGGKLRATGAARLTMQNA